MADINARLKRALDGPAPQHKVAGEDALEMTEGSGGHLHVKDADVSAELAEIKRTQADILERLDGTINTQVTGSNVEYATGMKETERFLKTSVLKAGEREVIAEITNPCVLESLMVGTSYNTMIIRIENRLSNGSYQSGMKLIAPNGGYSNSINPASLNALGGENDYWRTFVYDGDKNEYAFGMKRTSTFGNGVRISVENINKTDHNIGITCLVTHYHTI